MFRFLKRCILALGMASVIGGGLSVVATAAASTPRGWVATHTLGLHLKGRHTGAAPAGQRLEISVTLPLRDRAEINRLIAAKTVLTPAEVKARFGPTTSQVSAVEAYLRSRGFGRISASSNRLLVTAHGTVAQAERAFHTTIATYRLDGHSVYANTAAALVPSHLRGDVVAVLGISDVPAGVDQPTLAAPDTSGFTPRAIQHAYDAASMPTAASIPIAIIASGNMNGIIANLRYAEQQWHFPKVPVQVIYDGPKAGIVNNNPLTGNLEWDLDTQESTMVAGAVKRIYIYDVATFTDPEVARGINMFVAQDRARNLSASLGECDYIAWFDGAMVTTDESLAEGALQGQSAFASTGDNGYACPEIASTGLPEGPPGVSWPADGEYTTAVGGTTLVASSSGQVQKEIAWVGGGGGVSPFETAAPWTLGANGAGQTWEFTNQGGRTVPDVAAVADPNTPVLIYGGHTTGTQPTAVGGTSVSSPLTMGLWSRVQRAYPTRGKGLAQYDFYVRYLTVNPATVEQTPLGPIYIPDPNPTPVNGFRDITVGTNGGCAAKPGYDDCTGIGSVLAAQWASSPK